MNYTYFWFSCLSCQTHRDVYFFKPKGQSNLRTSCNTRTPLTTVSRITFMFHNKIHFQAYSRSMFKHFESIWYIRAIQRMFSFTSILKNVLTCWGKSSAGYETNFNSMYWKLHQSKNKKATWLHLCNERSGIGFEF